MTGCWGAELTFLGFHVECLQTLRHKVTPCGRTHTQQYLAFSVWQASHAIFIDPVAKLLTSRNCRVTLRSSSCVGSVAKGFPEALHFAKYPVQSLAVLPCSSPLHIIASSLTRWMCPKPSVASTFVFDLSCLIFCDGVSSAVATCGVVVVGLVVGRRCGSCLPDPTDERWM